MYAVSEVSTTTAWLVASGPGGDGAHDGAAAQHFEPVAADRVAVLVRPPPSSPASAPGCRRARGFDRRRGRRCSGGPAGISEPDQPPPAGGVGRLVVRLHLHLVVRAVLQPLPRDRVARDLLLRHAGRRRGRDLERVPIDGRARRGRGDPPTPGATCRRTSGSAGWGCPDARRGVRAPKGRTDRTRRRGWVAVTWNVYSTLLVRPSSVQVVDWHSLGVRAATDPTSRCTS